MSRYLDEQQYAEILNSVSIYEIGSDKLNDLSTYSFEMNDAPEYKNFLVNQAKFLDELGISKTFLLIHNETRELIGYFTLSADTIKLTTLEKEDNNLEDVPFMSLPAIKIGKIAINRSLSEKAMRKGYGSFVIEMAILKAYEVLEAGVACRFITVDADIEYNPTTPIFYEKNGFVRNEKYNKKNSKTISMRRDIFLD